MPPKAEVRHQALRLDRNALQMIQAPKPEPRITRYELSDYERHQSDAAEQAAWRSVSK
jgi:hypothetical protein